jgi:hypothetical protein
LILSPVTERPTIGDHGKVKESIPLVELICSNFFPIEIYALLPYSSIANFLLKSIGIAKGFAVITVRVHKALGISDGKLQVISLFFLTVLSSIGLFVPFVAQK